jgi:hypothetical protein
VICAVQNPEASIYIFSMVQVLWWPGSNDYGFHCFICFFIPVAGNANASCQPSFVLIFKGFREVIVVLQTKRSCPFWFHVSCYNRLGRNSGAQPALIFKEIENPCGVPAFEKKNPKGNGFQLPVTTHMMCITRSQ